MRMIPIDQQLKTIFFLIEKDISIQRTLLS